MNRFIAPMICGLLSACGALLAAEQPRIRAAGIDARNLPTVVAPLDVKRTASGWPTLNSQDFSLLEDGVSMARGDRMVKFRDANVDLALIVALDASGSMQGRPLAAIQKGLAQLVSRKRSGDRIAVLSFADDTHWETRWDTSAQATQDAFRNLKIRGNLTRLYDALGDAIQEFTQQSDKDASFPVRRSILVISDGHDEGSHTALAQILNHIRVSRVRVDAIGLAHSPLWLGSLRQVARIGFGEFQTVSSPEALTNLLGQGIDLLLDMPAVEFDAQSLHADGGKHRLTVESKAAGFHDDISLTLPQPFWKRTPALYYASGGLAALLIFGLLIWKLRRPKSLAATQPPLEVQIPTPPPPPPPLRAATITEPTQRVVRPISTPPVIRYAEPAFQAPTAVKPARVPTALAPGPMAMPSRIGLTATTGPYTGQTFPITEQEFWIGSAANNHLCLAADQGVSGNHACIRTEESFRRLYDNESLNNTWLNGRPVGREIAIIQPGDHIRLGASDFLVETNADA